MSVCVYSAVYMYVCGVMCVIHACMYCMCADVECTCVEWCGVYMCGVYMCGVVWSGNDNMTTVVREKEVR